MKHPRPTAASHKPPHAPLAWLDVPPASVVAAPGGRRADPIVGEPSSWLADCGHGLTDPESGYRFVVANRHIAVGEVVAVFGGTVITTETLRELGPQARARCLQVDEGLFLYSTVDGPGDWINHSCAPNLALRGQIVLVATRPILAGEELCFDYATADGTDFDEFSCRCGAPNCRGQVTGADWEQRLSSSSDLPASPYLYLRPRPRNR